MMFLRLLLLMVVLFGVVGCQGPTLSDPEQVDANFKAIIATVEKAVAAEAAGDIDALNRLGEDYRTHSLAYSRHLMGLNDEKFESFAQKFMDNSLALEKENVKFGREAGAIFFLPIAKSKEERKEAMEFYNRMNAAITKLGIKAPSN